MDAQDAPGAAPPRSLHLVGRAAARENGDICGEYVYAGLHHSRACYQKRGSATVIRYWPPMCRWVIDREGLRESDTCVAFADDVGCDHPANMELIWHVWESAACGHLPDAEVAAVDSPATLSLVGRSSQRENHSINGEYELAAVHHGRPAYRQRNGEAVMRYHRPEKRWLIGAADARGNVCSAFAEGANALFPGAPGLHWHFWEAQRCSWLPDASVRTFDSPTLLHVIGRAGGAENARINGTYRLVGAHEGRPVYAKPGTHSVIKYSAKSDRWLVDCDGLQEPSLVSRLYQWALSGDASAAGEKCSAFAEAGGSPHPGSGALQWQVWESRAGRHKPDPAVRATTAPLALQVYGRDASRENGDISGEYLLVGAHNGRPAYLKSGTTHAIRFWPPMCRWVIDREGLRNADTCVAFVDDPAEAEHPAGAGPWHVFESSRGRHLPDLALGVVVPADAPLELRTEAAPGVPGVVGPGVAKHGLAGDLLPEAKRRRPEDAWAQPGLAQPFLQHGAGPHAYAGA